MEVRLVVRPSFCFLDCSGRFYLFFAGPLWKAWTSGGRHVCKVCFFFFDISEEKGKYQNVCILQAGQPSSHDGNFDRGRLPRYSQVEIFFSLY